MIGGNQTPFRLPCGSTGVPKYFLGRPNHRHAAEAPAYGNTTQMQDHCDNTVTAKERKYQTNTCGDDICAPDCSDCPGGTDLITNTPEPPKISENTWSAATGTVQLEPNEKIGFKIVQAFKNWHGRFGFLHDPTTGANCDLTALSNTKYRTLRIQITLNDIDLVSSDPATEGGYPAVNQTHTKTLNFDITYSVGRLTGETTLTIGGISSHEILEFADSSPPGYGSLPLDALLGIIERVLGHDCDWSDTTEFDDLVAGCVTTNDPDIGGDYVASSFTRHRYSVSDSVFNLGATWYYKGGGCDGDGAIGEHTIDSDITITLSDAYEMDDVLSDAAELAAEWQLTDDLKYPFRPDAHQTVAPLVLRNENPAPVPLPIDVVVDWTDEGSGDFSGDIAAPTVLGYDGSIIGSPLAAGYGQPVGGNPRGVFDKDHENWFRRNCTLTVGWTQANESRGGFTPSYLPSNAPKWTDDFNATRLWPCAFINADVSGIYLQKWCEIKLRRPSTNCARPFGPDKFALDETAVFYVSDFTSGVVTLQTVDFATPSSLPFTTGDIVGSAAVGGFFAVTAVGSDTITLGAKVYDLPTGWETPSHDGGFCFGRLKYPNAPGMNFTNTGLEVGGRVAITVADGVPVRTLTTGTVQKYLSLGVNPEMVDMLDANLTPLATDVDLTRLTDSTFTVTEAYATISTAAWIVPHVLNDGTTSGQKYKFADERSKGDYVHRTWLIRISDATVLATAQDDACLQFQPCGPSVAGFTPNGELSTNADFWPFPTSINNGEVWLGQIQFWMPDPFWQPPHKPVDLGDPDFEPGVDIVLWAEDTGGCAEDFTELGGGGETIYHRFYPMRAYVEARCTLPDVDGDTAPDLASGVDLTDVADPPGQAIIVDIEGALVDAIGLPTATWSKMLAQRGCVDDAGRFASDYAANGTTPTPA